MSNRRVPAMAAFSIVLLLAFGSLAAAQIKGQWVPRAGVGGRPGQAFVGAHLDVKEVANKTWFRPSAEIGIGDGTTMFTLNGDFVYFWKGAEQSREWLPYIGGGPAFVANAYRSGNGKSGVGPGFDFLVGIRERKGLLVEVQIGAFDSPRFRAGLGWTWK